MNPLGRLLDASIFFSFDRSGYRRHARRFDPADLDVAMDGKTCLVTGANGGLGLALARGLAARGAQVHMLCRSAPRGEAARAALAAETGNPSLHLHVVDVSETASIRRFVEALGVPRVDVLIHNAGVLPLERETTSEGLERTVATHLVGPHLLTALLRPRLGGARVIWVSSGGMYGTGLDIDAMLDGRGEYDGVAAYARTKRGQVVLSELWAEALSDIGAAVHAMHPGWAATPGVERALPRFWRTMERRLRTPEEGADTALWLAVSARVPGKTGGFWFDRRRVRTHLVPWTRERVDARRRLWQLCMQMGGLT